VRWQQGAACDGADSAMFFPDVPAGASRPDSVAWRAGKALCARCDVRDECLAMAFREDIKDGLWGGLTPAERSKIRRAAGASLASVVRRWVAS
jgi:WhiB family redox-sensing transcriptional regulator